MAQWLEYLAAFAMVSGLWVVPLAGQQPVLDIVDAQLHQQQT